MNDVKYFIFLGVVIILGAIFAMIITQLIVNAKEILCQRPFSQNKLIK